MSEFSKSTEAIHDGVDKAVSRTASALSVTEIDPYVAKLDVLRSQIEGFEANDARGYSQQLDNMNRELNKFMDQVLDDESLSSARQDELLDLIRNEADAIPEIKNKVLSANTEHLSDDVKRIIGLSDNVDVDANKYTVQLGNHRTAAVLVQYNKGALDGDAVVGKIVNNDQTTRPLTVSELVENYRDNNLHSSNSNRNGDAWVDYNKVTGITDNFDVERFFDTSRDGGEGIVLRQVPNDTGLAKFSSVVDLYDEKVKFTNFLYEQSYDALPTDQQRFSSASKTPDIDAPDIRRMSPDVPKVTDVPDTFRFQDIDSKLGSVVGLAAIDSAATPSRNVLGAVGDMNSRFGNSAQVGASAYGLVQGSMNLYQSINEGDNVGIAVSGSDVIISGVDVGFDIAQARGAVLSSGLTSTMAKANIALTIADIGYQVYKEDGNFIDEDGGVGHKSERAIAGTATAAVGIGTGAVLTSGFLAGAGGVALTGAVAVAAPVVVAAGAVMATAHVGEMIIDTRRTWDNIEEDSISMTRPKLLREMDSPDLSAYQQSMLSFRRVSHHMRSSELSEDYARHPNYSKDRAFGEIVDMREVDFIDPRNLAEFERALDLEIKNQERIIEENSSSFPNWLRGGDDVTTEMMAKTDLRMLISAKEEVEMFKKELAEYNQIKPELNEIYQLQHESATALNTQFSQNSNSYTILNELLSEFVENQNDILTKIKALPDGQYKERLLEETNVNITNAEVKIEEVDGLIAEVIEQQKIEAENIQAAQLAQQEAIDPQQKDQESSHNTYTWERPNASAFDIEVYSGVQNFGSTVSLYENASSPLSSQVFNPTMQLDQHAQLAGTTTSALSADQSMSMEEQNNVTFKAQAFSV